MSANENNNAGNWIGIDLGTSYTRVAIYQDNDIKILPNEQGNFTTPSYIAFTESECLIGDGAKYQAAMNVDNTIYGVKRLVGRGYSDPFVQENMKRWSFVLSADRTIYSSKPPVQIEIEQQHNSDKKYVRPEKLTAMLLKKMRNIAESHLGNKVENAAITVPANFNNAQRVAAKNAGYIAGFKNIRILNEPMAAAMTYQYKLNDDDQDEKNVLIFDLGGGTCDVSLFSMEDGIIEAKTTAGDTNLGGQDLDQVVVDFLVMEFKRRHQKDLTQNHRSMCRLRAACERAKRTLSSSTRAQIQIECLFEDIDFSYSFGRARFEDLCGDHFRKCITLCEKVIMDAGIAKDDIDDVMIVGGSTRIPKLQFMLSEFFHGKELCQGIHPEEAVVYGAAIQAAILSGLTNNSERLSNILPLDVIPRSLGIDLPRGRVMDFILKRNSTFPMKRTRTITKHGHNYMVLDVYEGDNDAVYDNDLLGRFCFVSCPHMPVGPKQVVDVSFCIDEDGILSLSAVETSTGREYEYTIEDDMGCLSQEDIEKMAKEIS